MVLYCLKVFLLYIFCGQKRHDMENNQHVELRLAAELKTSTCTALSHVDIYIYIHIFKIVCRYIKWYVYIYMRYILDECYMYI